MRTAQSTEPQATPASSSVYVVSLDELDNAIVRTGANYWRALKAGARLPAPLAAQAARHVRHPAPRRAGEGDRRRQGLRVPHHRRRACPGLWPDVQGHAHQPGHGRGAGVRPHDAQPLRTCAGDGRFLRRARLGRTRIAGRPLRLLRKRLPAAAEDGETVDHILVVSIYGPRRRTDGFKPGES